MGSVIYDPILGKLRRNDVGAFDARLTAIENQDVRVTCYTTITGSSLTGTVTVFTGATIITDALGTGQVAALLSELVNGIPSGQNPHSSTGVPCDVVAFDSAGNYTISHITTSNPVGFIYFVKIKFKDLANIPVANIFGPIMPYVSGNTLYLSADPTSLIPGSAGDVAIVDKKIGDVNYAQVWSYTSGAGWELMGHVLRYQIYNFAHGVEPDLVGAVPSFSDLIGDRNIALGKPDTGKENPDIWLYARFDGQHYMIPAYSIRNPS